MGWGQDHGSTSGGISYSTQWCKKASRIKNTGNQLPPPKSSSGYFILDHSTSFHLLDKNECLSKPCQNGGLCIDSDNRYSCQCVAGFTGINCESSKNHYYSVLM